MFLYKCYYVALDDSTLYHITVPGGSAYGKLGSGLLYTSEAS